MVSTTADRSSAASDVRVPSVLVVLVAKDGARWLPDCLQGLSGQTHPRIGVIAVDNGSADGSREMLEKALGPGRVISLADNPGLAGAVRAAIELPVAQEADYLLILHDDTALAPDAVARLLEAAEGIKGVEQVGVVGPKVVDWEDPRILREVGRSTDRFGHPYTPLQDGEMDHGQYDRVLEVLFVSSCAMLVSRDAWQRTGLPDERLASHHEDLDFCWRARLAGFRVLMTPLAQARHRSATMVGERPGEHHHRSPRYFAERAALASMLKNYGVFSLLWLLPLYALLGLGRLVLLTASRRFEGAFELLAAWGWNLARLPGTLQRRIRAQSVRRVSDRTVRRFMESAAIRVPRWFEAAGEIVAEQRGFDVERAPFSARVRSLAGQHPAFVAWALAFVVAALAYRNLVGPEPVEGGVAAGFPSAASFFQELLSGVRTTGLGGAQSASPALALLGVVSTAAFDGAALAHKLILVALPPIAGVVLYRAVLRQTGQRVAAVIAGGAYALSAVVLWAFSEGRIDVLVALAAIPAVADRLETAFGPDAPWRPWRFAVGFGVLIALGLAFYPGVTLAIGVLVGVQVLFARRRIRGLSLAVLSLTIGAVLVFPVVPDLVDGGGEGLGAVVGAPDFWLLARLAPGTAPGSWAVAWFLPVAALMAFGVVGSEHRGRAYRAVIAALAGLVLAWLGAAGYLPAPLWNTPAYIALAAASEAALLGYGLASIVSGMGRQTFGSRQVVAGILALVLAAGLTLQGVDAARGDWAIGPGKLPPAWPLVDSSTTIEFRVLWLGTLDGRPFPAPGGDPQQVLRLRSGSLGYSVTDRRGTTALDTGRDAHGPGYDYTDRVLMEILSGTTRHAGALLAPLGVRFVVADSGRLPAPVAEQLDTQLDLSLIPAGGLTIFRNTASLPPAAQVESDEYARSAMGSDLLSVASLRPTRATPLHPFDGGWSGTATQGSVALLADQFVSGWRLSYGREELPPFRSFGWGTGFSLEEARGFTVTYSRQWVRTLEMGVLGLLWLAALWITRKPVSA